MPWSSRVLNRLTIPKDLWRSRENSLQTLDYLEEILLYIFGGVFEAFLKAFQIFNNLCEVRLKECLEMVDFFTKDIESQFQSVIEILIESFIRIDWKLHNHERGCAV